MNKKIIISISICASMFFLLTTFSCGGSDDSGNNNNSLSPARDLVGTWKTSSPVRFTYETDFCTGMSGTLEDVAQEYWDVTWVITAAASGNENQVDIEMTFTLSDYSELPNSCGGGATGHIPAVSPQFPTATLSSSAITIDKSNTFVGETDTTSFKGSFTTSLIQGTWHSDSSDDLYSSGEYTASSALKLVKQ